MMSIWPRRSPLHHDHGATVVEYALLVGVLALGLIGGIAAFQDGVESSYTAQEGAIRNDPGKITMPDGFEPASPILEEEEEEAENTDDTTEENDDTTEENNDENNENDENNGNNTDDEVEEEPDPLSVTAGSPLIDAAEGATGNDRGTWTATLSLAVNRGDGSEVEYSFSPAPLSGSNTGDCVVSGGSCLLQNVGPWENPNPGGQQGTTQVTVTVTDGFGQTTSFVLNRG